MRIHSKYVPRCLALFFAFVFLASVRADVRPNIPPHTDPTPATTPPDEKNPRLQLTTDADAHTAHLRLPKSLIDSLVKRASEPTRHADAGMSPTSTMIAGTSLSIAIVLGGLMFVRGQSGRRRRAALIIVVGAGIFATTLLADIPPRPQPPIPPVPKPTPDLVTTDGSVLVEVEVVNDGPIQLTLPTKQAEALLKPKLDAPGK